MKRRYVVLAPLLLLLTTTHADATTGDLGYDVSWPQCSGSLPSGTPPFAIVGVNHGSAWSTNTCLQAEVTWAASLAQPAMLYANTANPAPSSSFYWPTSGSRDPALCGNASVTTDTGCAYDYGWHTASNALQQAQALSQGSTYPTTLTWWLDVEAINTWNGDGISNAADLQGMVDRLRSAGVPDVGVYVNGNDWPQVTGSSQLGTAAYTRATSQAYRAHWSFVPKYPIEDGPMWFAGLNTESSAISRCSGTSLTGGEKLLSQYDDGSGYDRDYRCADADHTAPTVHMTAPVSILTTTPTTTVTWAGSDTGGSGLASWDLQARKAPYNASFGAWSTIGSRLLSQSIASTSPARGGTTCWSARSRDAAGNVSAFSSGLCATTPLDDRDLSASTGWTRTTGASAWYAGSYSSSTKLGATLTRTGAQTSRLLLLAYRCPTCGSVTVLLNGSTLRTLSLASSTSGRAWISLPRFSLRTATITLRVATSGKLVRIDALATSRV